MISELRLFQSEAVQRLARPVHLLCLAPTGAGKSRIIVEALRRYELRAWIISPLVALNRQHERILADAGLARRSVVSSPEAAETRAVQDRLRELRPNFVVIDECHCVPEWGARFRPAFAEIPARIRALGVDRSLWLTATLPPAHRNAIEAALGEALIRVGTSGISPTLRLEAQHCPWPRRLDRLCEWVAQNGGGGVVFAATREMAERLGHYLRRFVRALERDRSAGRGNPPRPVRVYHAGLAREERLAIEAELRARQASIIVATPAFGMGMDFAQLEWALMFQAPLSIAALVQALGRAGRGPRGGRARVLWDEEDFRVVDWAWRGDAERTAEIRQLREFLGSTECRRKQLASHFGDGAAEGNCGHCDRCADFGHPAPAVKKPPKSA